jgi:diadenosine tetraphosphate (Ap4A) HIT family hydrolase
MDLAGLLGSVGIQHAPTLLPFYEAQSKECVAVRHPKPEGRFHLVFLPKRDVRNVLELTTEDIPFLVGCLALAREQVAKAGVRNYRFVTNGPELQHVTYFHFHVIAK